MSCLSPRRTLSLPSLVSSICSGSSTSDEEFDGFTLTNRDGVAKSSKRQEYDMVCSDNELLAAARDAERLSEAITHRDGVIQELTQLRKREKEEFEQRKNEMYAEMRMLRGMVQSLNTKLQQEREKYRQASMKSKKTALPGSVMFLGYTN